jgi:predicted nucleic acid-binding protein
MAWSNHQFHTNAVDWMMDHRTSIWATCAITELGFIRTSCQSSIFGAQSKTPAQASKFLSELTEHEQHLYLADLPPVTRCTELARILGPNKVTDAYLLSLARHHHCRFVTFDRRLVSIAHDEEMVEVLSPPI